MSDRVNQLLKDVLGSSGVGSDHDNTQLMLEVTKLRAQLDEHDKRLEKLSGILTATANVLKGEPRPNQMHSWHDLAQVAEQTLLRSGMKDVQVRRLEKRIKQLEAQAAQQQSPGVPLAEVAQLTDTCLWTPDDDGVFQTSCGHAFTLETDGPIDNQLRYCGYCGQHLVEARVARCDESVAGVVEINDGTGWKYFGVLQGHKIEP